MVPVMSPWRLVTPSGRCARQGSARHGERFARVDVSRTPNRLTRRQTPNSSTPDFAVGCDGRGGRRKSPDAKAETAERRRLLPALRRQRQRARLSTTRCVEEERRSDSAVPAGFQICRLDLRTRDFEPLSRWVREALFQTGGFIESRAARIPVVCCIRTGRPSFASRPSASLAPAAVERRLRRCPSAIGLAARRRR